MFVRSSSLPPHVFMAVIFLTTGNLPATRGDPLSSGMLYPIDTEFRQIKSLDGIWKFRTAPVGEISEGYEGGRWLDGERGIGDVGGAGPILDMPVPSSYNDITTNSSLRDYNGWAWYERMFYVPASWSTGTRVVLRFGSAHYYTKVWVNGKEAMSHIGGHLPFEAEVTTLLKYGSGGSNVVTVAINNTLTQHTIPQGSVTFPSDPDRYPPGYVSYSYTFDFFNYAGIHRPVVLYSTPTSFIDDINVRTILHNSTAYVEYDVEVKADINSVVPALDCFVILLDHLDDYRAEYQLPSGKGCAGTIEVPQPKLWWPHTMHPKPGHLYTLEVRLMMNGNVVDIYRQNVGIRMIEWNETSFTINGQPVYLKGFGRHEDSDIRGKGLDLPLVTRDHNLLSWVGANSYRTSHYPYAEEIMDFADRMGFLIVDECPAVNLDNYDDELLERHKTVMSELVRRDKNRPSVVMWSIANEPRSQRIAAGPYFSKIVNHTKSLDDSRPITMATAQQYYNDKAAQYLDIIGVNRYYSWYSDTGHLELVQHQVETEITRWNEKFNKPVFMTEYGADAVAGLHTEPVSVWTEDYQVALMREYFKAFNNLRSKGFFIGEMIWNFADFATAQGITRVVGNRKGVFTRTRQPKWSARFLRDRYWCLANQTLSDNSGCI